MNSKGELGNSHPCSECVKWMHKLHIKRVFFSTGIINNEINNCANHQNNHNCRGPCACDGPHIINNDNNNNNNDTIELKWEKETWRMLKVSELVESIR